MNPEIQNMLNEIKSLGSQTSDTQTINDPFANSGSNQSDVDTIDDPFANKTNVIDELSKSVKEEDDRRTPIKTKTIEALGGDPEAELSGLEGTISKIANPILTLKGELSTVGDLAEERQRESDSNLSQFNSIFGLGLGDEIASGLGLEETSENIIRARERLNTVDKLKADTLGALAPGVGAAKLTGLTAKGLSKLSKGQIASRTVGAGALEGAFTSFATADDKQISERSGEILQGLLIGGATAGAANLVLSGGAKLAKGTSETFKRVLKMNPRSKERKAVNRLIQSTSDMTGVDKKLITREMKSGKDIISILFEQNVPENKILQFERSLLIGSDKLGESAEAFKQSIGNRFERLRDSNLENSIARVSDRNSQVAEVGSDLEKARLSERSSDPDSNLKESVASLFSAQRDQGTFYKEGMKVAQRRADGDAFAQTQAGYGKGEKPKLVYNEEGSFLLPDKGAVPLQEATDSSVIVSQQNGPDLIYNEDDLVEFEFDGTLLSELQSTLKTPLKEGAEVPQEVARDLNRASETVSISENKLSPVIEDLKDRYANLKGSKRFLDDVKKVIGKGSPSPEDIVKLLTPPNTKVGAQSTLNQTDRLSVLVETLDNTIGSGNTNNLLDINNDKINTVVKKVLKANGATKNQIDNITKLAKEVELAKSSGATIKSSGTESNFIRDVMAGSLNRWYLGPEKAVIASTVWNSAQALAFGKKWGAPLKGLTEEQKAEIIKNVVDLPDEEFVGLMSTIAERNDGFEFLKKLVQINSAGVASANRNE